MLVTAWAWFGVTGSVPVLIWWWRRRPADVAEPWLVDLAAVRAARLGPWRTRLVLRRGPPVEIFHDEIAAADLARLRRTLKTGLRGG
ncbi:MAG TPA: hypothetical protein VF210_08350 [Pseudomonadales bacterium]